MVTITGGILLLIAFYGIARQTGTSANMAAVAAGLAQYQKRSVLIQPPRARTGLWTEAMALTDCTNSPHAAEIMRSCNLLVLNFSIPHRGLEKLFMQHALSGKNVLFLVGKYYKDQSDELKKLSGYYRLERRRICAIPYHPGFGRAYEENRVPSFVKNRTIMHKTHEGAAFETHLKRTACAVAAYAERKGEKSYG